MDVDLAFQQDAEMVGGIVLPEDNSLAVLDPLRSVCGQPVIFLVRQSFKGFNTTQRCDHLVDRCRTRRRAHRVGCLVSLTSGIQINVSSKFRQIRGKLPANSIRIIQYLNPYEEPILGLTRLSSQTRRAYLSFDHSATGDYPKV